MDRFAARDKPAYTVMPAKYIIVRGEFSTCGFNESEAWQKTPIQTVLVSLGNENTG